jgi:hypothetical protein
MCSASTRQLEETFEYLSEMHFLSETNLGYESKGYMGSLMKKNIGRKSHASLPFEEVKCIESM